MRNPIATAPHDDTIQVWLFAEHILPTVWEWVAANSRWERACGLYWAEGEYGPEFWAPVVPPSA